MIVSPKYEKNNPGKCYQDRGKSASYRKSDVIFGIIMSEKPLVSSENRQNLGGG